jgi:hypothetical protein
MKIKIALALLCCSAFGVLGAEVRVPAELISQQTAVVVDLNFPAMKREQLLKSFTDTLGEEPTAETQVQYDDFVTRFSDAGGATISVVWNIQKDQRDLTEGLVLVVGLKDGAEAKKVTEFLYAFAPDMKYSAAPECPRTIGGNLVWYQKAYILPKASVERRKAFEAAYTQLPAGQSFSVVLIPDENAAEQATSTLGTDEAEMVSALMNGGICLFSNVGIAAHPTLKMLVLSPDAAGATKLTKVATELIVEMKEKLPSPFERVLDYLKVSEAGSNVQVSIALPEWTKIARDVMAATAEAAVQGK